MTAPVTTTPLAAAPAIAAPAGALGEPRSDDDRTPSARGTCTHCGAPVAAALCGSVVGPCFCCHGCETVYTLLTGHGLSDYYRVRAQYGASPEPGKLGRPPADPTRESTFIDIFADSRICDEQVTVLADGQHQVELLLDGVHCGACLWLLERLPRLEPGIRWTQLNLERQAIKLRWDPGSITLLAIARRLAALGYTPHLLADRAAHQQRRVQDRALKADLAVAGAAMGNVMLLAFALYAGADRDMSESTQSVFRWASAGIAVPAVLWSARSFFTNAWNALAARAPHLDIPIALGILVNLGWGSFNTLRGEGEIYFDSVTALVFLLLLGRLLQRAQLRRAQASTERLYALVPARARRLDRRGVAEDIPTRLVLPGDRLQVRAGERIPVDGTVEQGESKLDTSWLTGEAKPQTVAPGITVNAGTVNLRAELILVATKTGHETRVAQVLESMKRAGEAKAPFALLADRLSGYFLLAVLLAAAATFAGWARIDLAHAAESAVAVLIVSCPCALGLATPLATAVGLAAAARQGILIRGAEFLEALSRPGLWIFDKTGTLTQGKLRVAEWWGDESLAPLVAAVEAHSSHPVAAALCAHADVTKAPGLAVEAFEELPSQGVRAQVAQRQLVIGSVGFVTRHPAEIPELALAAVHRFERQRLSPVLIAVDGRVTAVAGIGDPVRPDAEACLAWLASNGQTLSLLSGDRGPLVQALADDLGVPLRECLSEASPEQKLEYVRRQQRQGPVFMVGDGVNDAAALRAATVGIAVCGGAEPSLHTAGVYLAAPGMQPVLQLVQGARHTVRVIRRALAFSLIYNLVAVSFGMAGLLTPLIAAVLMPLSSLGVVALALSARSFGRQT